MAVSFLDVIDKYFTCEMTTLSRDGAPVTWPVSPRLLEDGRFLVTTSIGLPQKAFNVRRNPKVSMLFSEPKGSGVSESGAVLIQGEASSEDRIITDVSANEDLTGLAETLAARQPSGALWSTWIGKRMWWSYYMRLLIYVTPQKAWFWPSRDFTSPPEELDVRQVHRVG